MTVLKVDIEGGEWPFLDHTRRDKDILGYADQFQFETHFDGGENWADVLRRYMLAIHYLEKQGFVLFAARRNSIGQV